jgi:hypothetical protein
MIAKILFVSFLLASVAVNPRYGCQTTSPGVAKPAKQKMLKLVAEYRKNSLKDISSDGTLMLFYQTSTPMRTYTVPLDGSPSKPNQPVADDILRIVEREGGRQISRIGTNSFPYSAQFVPGTQQVFYSEQKEHAKPGILEKLWNPTSGQVLVCLDSQLDLQPNETFLNITAISPQKAIGALAQEGSEGDLVVALTLPNCNRTIIGPVNPSDPKTRFGGVFGSRQFSLSPNRDQVAYETRGGVIIVRDTATLKTVKQIEPSSGLIFGGRPIYTPDGKLLLVVASNTTFDKPETRRHLLFYDATSYDVARELDITSWSPPVLREDVAVNSNDIGTAMAISPDSRFLAVGYTKEEKKGFSITEQAHIVVYDLTTGEEVARASHPQVKQQRSDPFAARIGKLAFTPEGKYLLSSTHDTLVWEIISKGE